MKKEKVFKPWAGKVAPFVYDKEVSYFDLVVPTVDTTKYAYLLEIMMDLKYPMFYTGNTGVGKSAMIQAQLALMKQKEIIMPIFINMSA
jgi:dynein heavy chain